VSEKLCPMVFQREDPRSGGYTFFFRHAGVGRLMGVDHSGDDKKGTLGESLPWTTLRRMPCVPDSAFCGECGWSRGRHGVTTGSDWAITKNVRRIEALVIAAKAVQPFTRRASCLTGDTKPDFRSQSLCPPSAQLLRTFQNSSKAIILLESPAISRTITLHDAHLSPLPTTQISCPCP
jgi:hypothetical protein